MAAPGYFPLLVEGSWGPDPPKSLITKLQLYFQSQKRSGGGECEVRQEPGSPARFLVLFHRLDVQQNVLERGNHELVCPGKGTLKLTVKLPPATNEVNDASKKIPAKESKTKEHAKEPDASEDTQISLNERSEKMEVIPKQCENIPSLVAFENLKANVTDMMLTLLVENISGLSSADFEVEILRDFDVGVVTFRKYIDAMKFVEDCAMHRSVTQLQLSPRLLEMTKIIRVENLPPDVDSYNLKCLFENPQTGGGRVVSIECFPEESSALIEFFDRKVFDTIITKKLDLNNMPLSVFPYYTSLGTALYGKEKPLIKLPAPFKESLDLSLWKFLHKRNHLIEEINEEVRRSHCELTWSPLNGEVTIRPAATLVNQGRKSIKNWKKDASAAFFGIRSRFKVTPFKVDPVVWDIMKNELEDERILTEFDTGMGIVTLVGKSEDVQNIEPQIKELIENATQKIKREEQSLKEKVAISPRKYSLLCHSGVQERLRKEYPEMEIFYDRATQHMCFKGLGVDVYKAKCEVQEKVYTMVQKSIQLPPEVFQFLQQVDCSELSKSLLIAQKILAVYELEGTTVFLTGCSFEVLLEAEKQMVSALSYKRIDIEDREVLNSKKWKAITNNLPKKYNSSSKTVTINELTSGTTAEVIIAGCLREVNEVYHFLSEFVEKNMKIEKFLEVKPPLVIDYLKAEKKLFLQKLKMNKLNVQVDFNSRNKPKGIILTGPKAEVLEGMNILKQVRDSVCVKSISIDKPGASQSFRDKPWYYKREVRSLGCFVELLQNEGKKEGGGSDGQKGSCRTELAPGVWLIVQQGDLTRFPVEVVVNVTNEDLRLSGGLAAALSKAAGPELQADCDRIVKKTGKIPTGHATISKAGKLPYHQVIHAVGPKWDSNDVLGCVLQLKNAVKRSLHLADNFQYQSIAIPAISSGDCGFPLSQCVETIVLTIKETFQYNWAGCTLKEVYLVDLAEKTVEAFAETVKTVFKNNKPGTASLPSVPAGVQPGPRNTDGNKQMLLCPGGLRILLMKGDVQNAMADVVVNSIPRDLNLNSGPLSQAFLAKAGPNLQKELNTAGQGIAVDVGTILQTTGCNLQCNQMLHVVAPNWNNGDTSSLKIMQDIIRKCLEMTENLSLNSIAFPAIGTGNLGFPKTVFAELIISEVFKYSSNNQRTALQEVCFLLHPSDHGNIQAFSDEFDKIANGNFISDKSAKTQNTQGLYGTVTSPASGVHEMKIGPITFQVATGDIAKEAADVIVNSTTKTFDHKAGVSKAILEKAGQNVETECSRLAQQHNNGYIITDGGSLKCKNIIHVAGEADVKRSVTCVLQECEKRNHSTICLPAIGTGSAQQDPDKVAEAILDAIEDFIQKGLVRSVKKVKVVIFQPQIMDVFCANLKKREGSQAPSQSIMSKIACLYGTVTSPASGVHEMKIGPITFQVATGDIAKEAADVIVNSTTKTFDHKAGVSKAILEKAGQNVETECSRLAQQHNNGYIITDGGSLKCKNIIHVVGGADVKRSVTCVLQECEKRNHSTICLPAIGTGSAQQDPDKVAEAILDAIEDFIQKGLVRSVKKVKVVIFQPQIMDVFCANLKKREGSQAPSQSIMSKIACLYGTVTSPASGVHEMKIGPITFQVATGDIAKEAADVIVNSTTKTFDHKAGVSKAILEKAGQNVETECSRLAQQHNNGYIITDGGSLKCKNIIHVVGGADVKRSVTCVLQECEKRNHSTICLPAIGTGSAQQDPDKVAEAILDAIEDFIQKGLVRSVKKVKVVIFQPQIMDVFCANLKKREGSQAPSQSIMSKIACLYGTVTSPASGVHEMKIGPITFQVATGDIAKEAADVIVNSTTKTFDHKAGVSKAILEKAGQNVETECSRLAQQHNNGYIITDGGSLKCKNIIHVVGGADVKRSVTCVLQECEKRNHSTICLPAIGTGSAQQDPDKVAEAILDAIEDFIQKGLVRSVKKVKVVIFQPQIMDVFCANLKKREGSQAPSQSIMSKIASLRGALSRPASSIARGNPASYSLQLRGHSRLKSGFWGFSKKPPLKQKPLVLEKKTESAIFQVCGENETSVENALSCLQSLMEKEQSLYTSEEECIRDFDEKEYQELNKLQKDLNILVDLDRQKPLIKVSGISRDVEQARNAVEEMIKAVRSAKEQESRADYITDFVEWQYDDNNTYRSFDKITNMKLEEARKKQGNTVDVQIHNQNYMVDVKTCIATGANGHSLQIQRITKPQVEIPSHWSDMKQEDVCLVELQPGQPEYSEVADAFNQTCSQFKIEKIERIQNSSLWQCYQIKKKNMDDKNGHTQNEKRLFHGTDADSLPHVNQHGFNRSYAGKNAVAYGKGSYFAVDANYSAHDTYSRPDANGKKHMYYVRVLTGLYTLGNALLLVPPQKNPQNPLDLYDTVTDNVSNPSLFVVFYDYQAYPEYLITFKQ